MDFERAKSIILEKIKNELRPELLYHNIDHTIDVFNSVCKIGQMEGLDEDRLLILKTAAIYHDSGMLIRYTGHEEASTLITSKYLPEAGYDQATIDKINNMILTTKLPQSASSIEEKILCDADLDYLGRDDFFMIAHRLQYEWNKLGILKTSLKEWYELQLDFLLNHNYFTASAKKLRLAKKEQNLREVRDLLCK